MKLDLLKNQWLEIVFEGRNKKYGAYDLRKSITKNTVRVFRHWNNCFCSFCKHTYNYAYDSRQY